MSNDYKSSTEYKKMNPHEKIEYYRNLLKTRKGLTSDAWHVFDVLEKQHEPEAYKKRKEEQHRSYLISYANQLSIEDLKLIIKEKEDAANV